MLPPGAAIPPLDGVIYYLIKMSGTGMPVLAGALVYLSRLRTRIHPQGIRYAEYGIFFTSVILASKYLNDCSLLNVQWATCSNIKGDGCFFHLSLREVNIMEIELLRLLEWDLHISMEELIMATDPIITIMARDTGSAGTMPRPILRQRHPLFQTLFPCTHDPTERAEGQGEKSDA